MKLSAVDEHSKLAAWLRSRYGRKPIRLIAQSIANDLLSTLKDPGPPISLDPLLSVRRVAAVRRIRGGRRSRMAQDGRLLVTDRGFVVEIKSGPETRVRFTLAHEIGHTIFYDLDSSPPRRLVPGAAPKDEETFCNLLASEILMPTALIHAHLEKPTAHGEAPSPTATIIRLAESFKVSTDAMARRLVEDLEVFEGIALGSRWLPKAATSVESTPSESAWRLSWWAASPAVLEPLYLPPVISRPKVGLDIVEQGYSHGAGAHAQVPLTAIRLGNLRKILRQQEENCQSLGVWVHPVIPEGVQLSSHDRDALGSQDPALAMRKSSEVVVFFTFQRPSP